MVLHASGHGLLKAPNLSPPKCASLKGSNHLGPFLYTALWMTYDMGTGNILKKVHALPKHFAQQYSIEDLFLKILVVPGVDLVIALLNRSLMVPVEDLLDYKILSPFQILLCFYCLDFYCTIQPVITSLPVCKILAVQMKRIKQKLDRSQQTLSSFST